MSKETEARDWLRVRVALSTYMQNQMPNGLRFEDETDFKQCVMDAIEGIAVGLAKEANLKEEIRVYTAHLYSKRGQGAVLDWLRHKEYNVVDWVNCLGCEQTSGAIDRECLVCGWAVSA